MDLIFLYQPPFELGQPCYSLSMMSYQGFFVRLKCQIFSLSFSHRRHWMQYSVPPANKLEAKEVYMNSEGGLSGDQLPHGVLFDPHFDINVETIERFCIDASQTFFNKFCLISHQIRSFDLPFDQLPHLDINVKTVERFYKDASRTFSMSLAR